MIKRSFDNGRTDRGAIVSDIPLRPGKIVGIYGRLYPDAWKQVDEFRAKRKELGNWPDWCFLPLAGTYGIVSKSKTLQPENQAHHIGILGALAAWRVTQGIYRFEPTTFDALWKTPVSGDLPAEVLFHLPEWCVYISTPDRTWQGAALSGFFAHLEWDMNNRRTELRLLLDATGAAGDQLEVIPIHLGKGGVAAGLEAMKHEVARPFPVTMYTADGVVESPSSDVSPLVSLVLYLCSRGAEILETGGGKRVPSRPKPQKTKKGMRIFPPDHPSRWEVGHRLGAALRHALSEQEPSGSSGTDARPHPQSGGARWHTPRVGERAEADARSPMLEWLPPVSVDVAGTVQERVKD
jgi:hypothetical protein